MLKGCKKGNVITGKVKTFEVKHQMSWSVALLGKLLDRHISLKAAKPGRGRQTTPETSPGNEKRRMSTRRNGR